MRHHPAKSGMALGLLQVEICFFFQMTTYHLIFKDSHDFTSSSPSPIFTTMSHLVAKTLAEKEIFKLPIQVLGNKVKNKVLRQNHFYYYSSF